MNVTCTFCGYWNQETIRHVALKYEGINSGPLGSESDLAGALGLVRENEWINLFIYLFFPQGHRHYWGGVGNMYKSEKVSTIGKHFSNNNNNNNVSGTGGFTRNKTV